MMNKLSGRVLTAALVALLCAILSGCRSAVPAWADVAQGITNVTVITDKYELAIDDQAIVAYMNELIRTAPACYAPEPEQPGVSQLKLSVGAEMFTLQLDVRMRDARARFADGWRQLPWNFIDLVEHLQLTAGQSLSGGTAAFFSRYNLTPVCLISRTQCILPEDLGQRISGSPSSLYWSAVNTFSAAIGLDMAEYAGAEVTVDQVFLAEPPPAVPGANPVLPEDPNRPHGNAYLVRLGEQIIGAWQGQVRIGASLDGHGFQQITGSLMADWLDYWRTDSCPEMQDPEQVIRSYFSAAEAGDLAGVYELVSSGFALDLMLANLDEGSLHHQEYRPFPEGVTAEFVSLRAFDASEFRSAGGPLYLVNFNLQLPPESQTAYSDGMNSRFFSLVYSLNGAGWRIRAISTSP